MLRRDVLRSSLALGALAAAIHWQQTVADTLFGMAAISQHVDVTPCGT